MFGGKIDVERVEVWLGGQEQRAAARGAAPPRAHFLLSGLRQIVQQRAQPKATHEDCAHPSYGRLIVSTDVTIF